MTWEANIQNLVKIGAVKITRRDEAVIHQRLADAEAYLTDARNVATTQSRFLLAVEGVRQVSLAVAQPRRNQSHPHRPAQGRRVAAGRNDYTA